VLTFDRHTLMHYRTREYLTRIMTGATLGTDSLRLQCLAIATFAGTIILIRRYMVDMENNTTRKKYLNNSTKQNVRAQYPVHQ